MKVDKDKIRFIVDIVDHCNLDCKCCGHFSPLAPKAFLDIETFENDLKRLHSLLNGKIYCFELMGGEALLHPHLEEFIKITNQYVVGEKNLCTNGVLLPSLSEEIYKLCAETDTTICITIYPININWEEIERKAQKYGTNLYKIKSKDSNRKIWFKNPRDIDGSQNIEENFNNCFWRGRCIVLDHGRLSSCVVPLKAKFFQNYFNIDVFDITEANSIDIYDAKSIDAIVDFLNKPIPCCRFCLPNKEERIEWDLSKKEIDEWI